MRTASRRRAPTAIFFCRIWTGRTIVRPWTRSSRRFKREIDGDERFARHPDLLLIDGGQTHAAVARRAMEQYGLDIPTFGMVKDDRHRTRALVTPEGREIGIKGAPALFAFIGQIQEETHRSAVGYHHNVTRKRASAPPWKKIPGIGPARENNYSNRSAA